MKTCAKCGTSSEDLWLSKSGYCEECAKRVMDERKAQAQPTAEKQPPTAVPTSTSKGSQNPWYILCGICAGIALVCLIAVGLGGFEYVGGDAYNIQITASVAIVWAIFAMILAVIGAAEQVCNFVERRRKEDKSCA